MQDKVSIAATKDKISSAAAKGGKAFMGLIHKVKNSSEDPKPTGTLSELKSPRTRTEPKSPRIRTEPKSPKILSEPESLKNISETESPKILSELKPTGALNDMDGDSDKPIASSPETSMEGKGKAGDSDEPVASSPKTSIERIGKLGDTDEPIASSPKSSMERKGKFVNRLKQGLKGKKSTDAEDRSELLGGNPHDQSPRVRSADSIKAAYGHKPSTDPTSIAAQNREKLIERQERLQAMNKQSEEMVEGAGDFASMAEELAKKIENKPWYKL